MYIKNTESTEKNQEVGSSWNTKNDVENVYKQKSHKKVVVKKCKCEKGKKVTSQSQWSPNNDNEIKFVKSSEGSNNNVGNVNNHTILTNIIPADTNTATISDNNSSTNTEQTHSTLAFVGIVCPIITLFIVGSAIFISKTKNHKDYNRNLERMSYTESLNNDAIKNYQNNYSEA